MADEVRPAGDYSSVVVHGGQAFIAGMTPKIDNVLVSTGRVGADLDASAARDLAGVAARRAIAALVEQSDAATAFVPLSMTVFVSCTDDFVDLSAVADGASEAIAEWSGGRLPSRAAVGVQSLPQGAPVEVSLVVGLES